MFCARGPADVVASTSTVCNAGSGDLCDPDELCTGVADVACPADVFASATTVCGPGSGSVCDPDELCLGVSDAACPAEVFASEGTACEMLGLCDVSGVCIPPDPFLAYDIRSKSMKSEKSMKSGKSNKSGKSAKSSKSAKFEKVEVGLEDQFQIDTFTVEKRVALLNPVDKNGEGISYPDAHLVGYKVKQFKPKGEPKPEKMPITDILVTDQFSPDGLIVDINDINKADRLLVPASKDLSEVPDPLDPVNADHYLCYKVKPPEGTEFPKGGQVLLVDQFTDPGGKLFDIGKPRQLCNPASKEFPEGTVSEIRNAASHLMCYSVKRAEGEPKHERTVIYLNDQFGPTEEWETRTEKEICLPADKTL